MEDSYRESIWRKKGRPRELYPDVSCKDAPVPPEESIPNCDCGHPAHVSQSRHPDTAARCFYTCYSCSVSHCALCFSYWFFMFLFPMRQLKLFCSPTSGAFSSKGSTGRTSLTQEFRFSTPALIIANVSCLFAGFRPLTLLLWRRKRRP